MILLKRRGCLCEIATFHNLLKQNSLVKKVFLLYCNGGGRLGKGSEIKWEKVGKGEKSAVKAWFIEKQSDLLYYCRAPLIRHFSDADSRRWTTKDHWWTFSTIKHPTQFAQILQSQNMFCKPTVGETGGKSCSWFYMCKQVANHTLDSICGWFSAFFLWKGKAWHFLFDENRDSFLVHPIRCLRNVQESFIIVVLKVFLRKALLGFRMLASEIS